MTRKLPNVLDEPDDRKRVWKTVEEAVGFSVFYVDRQFIWDAIAHELAERIRNHDYDPGEVGPIHLAYATAADLIDPEPRR